MEYTAVFLHLSTQNDGICFLSQNQPEIHSEYIPNFIAISPIAHVALLHTDMKSGLRFWPSIGKKSCMYGITCWKQAFVKSPSRANDDWRTYRNERINIKQ